MTVLILGDKHRGTQVPPDVARYLSAHSCADIARVILDLVGADIHYTKTHYMNGTIKYRKFKGTW